MLEEIKQLVIEKMGKDDSGHGFDHVVRVFDLAMKFAEKERADKNIIGIAALLHDVDDYKMVGKENAAKLINTKEIMNKVGVDIKTQKRVIDIINSMGFSKSLEGIRPKCLEGKIVSDADMCDGIGAHGIVRSIVYAISKKGSDKIFEKDIFPNVNITKEEYNGQGTTHSTDNAINHFFEKLLKLQGMMMTDAGREESSKRDTAMVSFLTHFFREEDLPEWTKFLENYLSCRKMS